MSVGRRVLCHEGMKAIAEALGIAHVPMQKLVIEMEVGHATRCYIKTLVPRSALPAIVQAVAGVEVTDKAEVVICKGE